MRNGQQLSRGDDAAIIVLCCVCAVQSGGGGWKVGEKSEGKVSFIAVHPKNGSDIAHWHVIFGAKRSGGRVEFTFFFVFVFWCLLRWKATVAVSRVDLALNR